MTREGKLISSSSVPRRAGPKRQKPGPTAGRRGLSTSRTTAGPSWRTWSGRRGGERPRRRTTDKIAHLKEEEAGAPGRGRGVRRDGALGVPGEPRSGQEAEGRQWRRHQREEAAGRGRSRPSRGQRAAEPALCLQNPSRPRHLVVAIGQTSYLHSPPKRSACQGHCLIVPMEHIPCTRVADANTLGDMRN